MRPNSIILFERLFLAMVVLGVINAFLAWDRSVADVAAQPGLAAMAPTLVLIVIGLSTIIYLLLWFFIARQASRIAKWIYIALVALSVAGMVQQVAAGRFGLDAAAWVAFLVLALMIWTVALLFRKDAASWLAGEGRGADAKLIG